MRSAALLAVSRGTTHDSIDISFTHDDQFVYFDHTAGIRRKHAEHEAVDKFAAIRTDRAIERSIYAC